MRTPTMTERMAAAKAASRARRAAKSKIWLVNAHTGARLREALDIEIAAIRDTRFGVKVINLRCGALSCRLDGGDRAVEERQVAAVARGGVDDVVGERVGVTYGGPL